MDPPLFHYTDRLNYRCLGCEPMILREGGGRKTEHERAV